MLDQETVDDVIERVVRSRFPNVQIDSVEVVPDVDLDGDRMLRITVVFDGQAGDLDPARMAGLVRHIRSALPASEANSFPLVTYMTRAEAAYIDNRAKKRKSRF